MVAQVGHQFTNPDETHARLWFLSNFAARLFLAFTSLSGLFQFVRDSFFLGNGTKWEHTTEKNMSSPDTPKHKDETGSQRRKLSLVSLNVTVFVCKILEGAAHNTSLPCFQTAQTCSRRLAWMQTVWNSPFVSVFRRKSQKGKMNFTCNCSASVTDPQRCRGSPRQVSRSREYSHQDTDKNTRRRKRIQLSQPGAFLVRVGFFDCASCSSSG